MRFVIRADASLEQGTGHVMRTSSIAEELVRLNYEVYFVGQTGNISWLNQRLHKIGFQEIYMSDKNFIPNPHTDILIIDSYLIPPRDSFIFKTKWLLTVSIVDRETPFYDAEENFHLGPELDIEVLKKYSNSTLHIGLEYFPIRQAIKEVKQKRLGTPQNGLLITGGGSDPFNFRETVTNIISSSALHPENEYEIIDTTKNYEESLFLASIAITTCGTSCWEFVYLEIPMAIVCAIDNQKENYNHISTQKLGHPVGVKKSKTEWEIDKIELQKFLNNHHLQENYRKSTMNIIDGNGASRIIEKILYSAEIKLQ